MKTGLELKAVRLLADRGPSNEAAGLAKGAVGTVVEVYLMVEFADANGRTTHLATLHPDSCELFEPEKRDTPAKPDPPHWGWFGASWGAPFNENYPRIAVPDGEVCPGCQGTIRPEHRGVSVPCVLEDGFADTLSYHLGCYQRELEPPRTGPGYNMPGGPGGPG